MQELVKEYTIVIVTHNMQQAARVSDRTAFFTVEVSDEGKRTGALVEFDRTETIFTTPATADRGLRDGAVRMTRDSCSTKRSSRSSASCWSWAIWRRPRCARRPFRWSIATTSWRRA